MRLSFEQAQVEEPDQGCEEAVEQRELEKPTPQAIQIAVIQ